MTVVTAAATIERVATMIIRMKTSFVLYGDPTHSFTSMNLLIGKNRIPVTSVRVNPNPQIISKANHG